MPVIQPSSLLDEHKYKCKFFMEFNIQLHWLQINDSDPLSFLYGGNIQRRINVLCGENIFLHVD